LADQNGILPFPDKRGTSQTEQTWWLFSPEHVVWRRQGGGQIGRGCLGNSSIGMHWALVFTFIKWGSSLPSIPRRVQDFLLFSGSLVNFTALWGVSCQGPDGKDVCYCLVYSWA
jgi:hypothetical protein